jgi:hypothetical protein
LAATRPQPASAGEPPGCRTTGVLGMFHACFPPAAPNAWPAGLAWPWSGTPTRSQIPGITPDLQR